MEIRFEQADENAHDTIFKLLQDEGHQVDKIRMDHNFNVIESDGNRLIDQRESDISLLVDRALGKPEKQAFAFQSGPRVRYLPYASLQIELTPTCEAQFAGADKHMKRQHHSQPSERAPVVVLDAVHQLRQAWQRECRPMRNPWRADEALKVVCRVHYDQP